MSIRKSAHGRTHLFLPEQGVAFREIKCMGTLRRNTASAFHTLRDAKALAATDASCCCWHCCEPVEGPGIPLPRLYDAQRDEYHVYGKTCSAGCAKAYILEHTTFDRGRHLEVFVRMMREVYGVHEAIREAPPRPALRRFGGDFDPSTQVRGECRVLEPPFVSYCMILQERVCEALESTAHDDDVEAPPPPGLFEEFAHRRAMEEEASPTAASTAPRVGRKRSSPPVARGVGPMARFRKPPNAASE